MAKIIIFTVKNCPKCDQLKKVLPKGYTEQDMTTPDALTHLRCHDIFTLSAPVLQVNDLLFATKSIFKDDQLNIKAIRQILRDALKQDVELVKDSLRGEGWDHMADTVDKLFTDNCNLSKRLVELTELNNDLMGHCNNLRKQLRGN